MKLNKNKLQLILTFSFFQGASSVKGQVSSVKMPVNKATVDIAKERKINNNHKSRNYFFLRKNTSQ